MEQAVKSEAIKSVEVGIESELLMTNDGIEEVGVDFSMGGQTIPDLASISVLPTTLPSLVAGVTGGKLEAYGIDSDGESVNITAMCIWTSADEDIATVDRNGNVEGTGLGGPINITATLSQGSKQATPKTDTCAVTVALPEFDSLIVLPATVSVEEAATSQLAAWGVLAGSPNIDITGACDWVSATPGTCTVGATTGLVTGVAAGGPIDVTATMDQVADVEDICAVTVTAP